MICTSTKPNYITTNQTNTMHDHITYFCTKCNKHQKMTGAKLANTFLDYVLIDLDCGHCKIQKLES